MSVRIEMHEPVLVFSPPVNEATSRWGVYAIPRLWRDVTGKLIIRFNGEEDCADLGAMQRAPNLYFSSVDEGESWQPEELEYDIRVLQGIGSPFVTCKNREVLAIRDRADNRPITGIRSCKEILHPCGEAINHAYLWGDIPPECRRMELLRYSTPTAEPEVREVRLDFAERELLVNALAKTEAGNYQPVPEYLKPFIFKNPYLSCLTEFSDGMLVALCFGQNPRFSDRYCSEIYLAASADGGLSWNKRGTVAAVTNEAEGLALPYGYGGDGYEASLVLTPDGELLCAMRMDMSINPDIAKPFCGTMLARSSDGGAHWEKPVPVSNESVTPHVVALSNGTTAVVYGRPGVHLIYSEDNLRSFSKPQSLIGRTLWQERRVGRSDRDSKYSDTVSYSNTFVEVLSEDTFLVLYNDLKYTDPYGICHKAAFTQKITLHRS